MLDLLEWNIFYVTDLSASTDSHQSSIKSALLLDVGTDTPSNTFCFWITWRKKTYHKYCLCSISLTGYSQLRTGLGYTISTDCEIFQRSKSQFTWYFQRPGCTGEAMATLFVLGETSGAPSSAFRGETGLVEWAHWIHRFWSNDYCPDFQSISLHLRAPRNT